jgi:hypothetical protein
MVKLTELTDRIRSKNANPMRYTFDVIFKNRETYEKVKRTGVLNKEFIANLYAIPIHDIVAFVWFSQGNALKITVKRQVVQCAIGETDLMGSQQHNPLLDIDIPLPNSHKNEHK